MKAGLDHLSRTQRRFHSHGPSAEHARDEGGAVVAAAAAGAAQEEEGVGLGRKEDDHQASQREQS